MQPHPGDHLFGNNYLLQLAERERDRFKERKEKCVNRNCRRGGGQSLRESLFMWMWAHARPDRVEREQIKKRVATLLHLLKLASTIINILYLQWALTSDSRAQGPTELKSTNGSRVWLKSAESEHTKMGWWEQNNNSGRICDSFRNGAVARWKLSWRGFVFV